MRKTLALAALACALTLSACHKPEDDSALNNTLENATEAAPVENVEETETPAANVTNTAAAPAPKVSEDQQVLDDADATGLTARIPENSSAPQQAE